MCVYVFVNVYVYVCMHLYVYEYTYLYIYIDTCLFLCVQFVFASLGGWALIFYFGYRAATGGKKTEASPPIVEQAKEEAAQ